MKKLISKLPENVKLAAACAFGFILVALMYYPLIPILLNYPPDSINNSFQIDVNYFYYTTQYLTIALIGIVVSFTAFLFLFKRVNQIQKLKDLNKATNQDLLRTIKTCFNYPLIVLLITLFVPVILIFVLLVALRQEFFFALKVTFIFFTMSSLIALISYSFSKVIFERVLNKIGIKDSTYGIRVNVRTRLMLQFLPLLLFTIIFAFLILYSQITKEKGDSLFDYYKQSLVSNFSDNVNSVEDAWQTLNSTEFKSDSDSAFILNSDETVVKSNSALSDFFTKYIFEYENTHNGHTYDYYGTATQGAFIRCNINGSDYILGIKYNVFSNDILSSVIPLFIVLFLINAVFIIYAARTLRNDIKVVSTNLSNISKNAKNYVEHRLSVVSNDEIGDLTIAFNKIQEMTKNNIEQIHSNQDLLIEKERLASLGQMIGGIAHNLKTPIMSISGAAEGLTDLIKEYENSVGDSDVTVQDHHEIAHDMTEWIEKMKVHLSYMSDIITAIKGQAVAFSEQASTRFTIEELIKNVDILMKHELKSALITLNTYINVDASTEINGNINSLIQVINNIISNDIQAYNGKTDETIELSIYKQSKNLIIKIEDHAGGLPEMVRNKLFKEMITTKGKNGTGLGLFMSYSNIRAHFNGNMRFNTETGKGTIFYIEIPLE